MLASSPAAARTVLGEGTMSVQNANNVGITGGTINGTVIGGVTQAAAAFTSLSVGNSAAVIGNVTVTSNSVGALSVGRQGATNPGLNVQANDANCVTGINIRSLATGNGSWIQATSSATNEGLSVDAKGSGTVFLGANSTGGANLASNGGPVTIHNAVSSFLNQGRFIASSSTGVTFATYNGSMVKINGKHYGIPSAGVAATNLFAGNSTFVNGVANQNLAATTLYYVYVFDNGGTLALDFSPTGRAASTTAGNFGTQIKSGDDTRSLVGMLYTNASAITDSDTTRTVLSWYNRQRKRLLSAFTAARTTASATAVELNSEIRCNFLCWGDDIVRIGANGSTFNSTTGSNNTGIGIDGVTVDAVVSAQSTGYMPLGLHEFRSVSEAAVHYATLVGYVSAGTGTWGGAGVNCKLSGNIMG
jgi:hypothetical protein